MLSIALPAAPESGLASPSALAVASGGERHSVSAPLALVTRALRRGRRRPRPDAVAAKAAVRLTAAGAAAGALAAAAALPAGLAASAGAAAAAAAGAAAGWALSRWAVPAGLPAHEEDDEGTGWAPTADEAAGAAVARACGFFDGADATSATAPPAGRLRRMASRPAGAFLGEAVSASPPPSALPAVVRQAVVPLAFLAAAALGDLCSPFASPSRPSRSIPAAAGPMDVHLELVRSTLPVGAGLGSSAALAVAAAASLLEAKRRLVVALAAPAADVPVPDPMPGAPLVSLETVNAWALAAETLFHGTPSGLDNTVATLGGLLRFRRGPGKAQRVPGAPPISVVVVNTHVPKSTKALVRGVAVLRETCPALALPALEAMNGVAAMAAVRLAAGEDVSALVTANHGLLCAIGVGHPVLDAVVAAASRGGMAAKLTGAGGGGCAFALVDEGGDAAALEAAAAASGWSAFRTRVGGDGGGVRIEP